MEVASALEGLKIILQIVVWIFDTFGPNLETKNTFTKFFKESC